MDHPDILEWEFQEKLGAGSYATVFKALKKETQEVVAIKVVEKAKLCKASIDNIITEIQLLKSLKHKHIVQMLDFTWDDKNIYIIMEWCNGGDLSSYIKRRHSLPESLCRTFLRQLALALQYMRANDVSHFDLKPPNLLLARVPGRYILKVADFGFAQHLKLGQENHSLKGSPLYMAPEIILKHSYDASADLWSVGVILYECLFGRAPYRSQTLAELLEKVKMRQRIEIPTSTKISPACEHLLRQLLRHDPKERISFEAFFDHEFLDLKYMPSDENLEHAADLFTRAVKADTDAQYKEAYHLYCDGLKYFMPIVEAESDVTKRQALRQRANAYANRAEEIKHSILAPKRRVVAAPIEVTSTTNAAPGTYKQMVESVLEPSVKFQQLYKLCASSPAIKHALDIGKEAELYAYERNHERAIESFKAALGELVPLLANEPKGQRRDLLHHQIKDWMDEAESIQALIETNRPIPEAELTDERCCIQ